MKKILGLIFTLIILGCGGYFIYINYIKDKVPKLVLEEEISTIDKYYIYGNHFNIEGNINIKDKQGNSKRNGTFVTGDKVTIGNGKEEKTMNIVIYGDINGDGKIDRDDCLAILRHLNGYTNLNK